MPVARVCVFSASITKSLGNLQRKGKQIYLAHSFGGLRGNLNYGLSSGEDSKVVSFKMVATSERARNLIDV